MKKVTFLSIIIFQFIAPELFSQEIVFPTEDSIPVCCKLTDPYYEFSGLVKWRNYVLLIPQHTKLFDTHNIIAIDTLSIDSVLTKQTAKVSGVMQIPFDQSLKTIIQAIQKKIGIGKEYGGFEAAVAIDNAIFFTVETDSICYIVKGFLKEEKKQWHVVFNPQDTLALPKPDYKFDNAGYESLTYLPHRQKLIAFYENCNLNVATACSFDANLQNLQPVTFAEPLLFRLTDVTTIDNNDSDVMLGVNHFYNNFRRDTGSTITEFNYYIANDTTKTYTSKQLLAALKQMHQRNLLTNSYTRIVQLTISNDKINWKEEKIISYSFDNWEGITNYKNGILMIVDGRPPGVNCKLSFFKLY